MNEDNVFSDNQVEATNAPTKSKNPYDNGNIKGIEQSKCPPGHYTSIASGGNGHSPNDDCGCDNTPSVSLDGGLPLLIIIAVIIIAIVAYKKT